ncbi:MAG: hypothetical protein NW216_03500 [Hyphomicrobium sp.]|nr:hypothetical protein [Hyphomicrobium sp.]
MSKVGGHDLRRANRRATRYARSASGCAAGLAAIVAASGADAEGYCIACEAPDAIYRCVVAGTPAGSPPDPRNQILCVKELAKAGAHARCSVERFTTENCKGEVRTIANAAESNPTVVGTPTPPAGTNGEGADLPLEAPSGGGGTAVRVDPDLTAATDGASEGQAEQKVEEKKPATVVDIAKETAEATKEGIDGTGKAIGDAAKKTWDCLKSLFGDC